MRAATAFIVAGDGYGMGSSREHGRTVPRILGIRAHRGQGFLSVSIWPTLPTSASLG